MKKEYDFSKAKRGPAVAASKSKARITIRLDEEVLEWLKAQVDAAGSGTEERTQGWPRPRLRESAGSRA